MNKINVLTLTHNESEYIFFNTNQYNGNLLSIDLARALCIKNHKNYIEGGPTEPGRVLMKGPKEFQSLAAVSSTERLINRLFSRKYMPQEPYLTSWTTL